MGRQNRVNHSCGNTFEREFSTGDVCLGRLLVGIGTISQRSPLDLPGKLFRVKITGSVFLPEVSADSIVIFGGHLKRLESKFAPKLLPDIPLAVFPSLQEAVVIGGIGKDGDPFVILSRSTEKGNTPDVDLLDRVREGTTWFRDGLGERIEIANHDKDGRNGLSFEVLFV